MQFRTIGLLLLGAMALPAAGTAQTTPAPPAITRTVIAATKLPTVTEMPLHFKAVSVTLQPYEKSGVSAANGILYQMSGSTEVALDGEARTLNAGEGLFIAEGANSRLLRGGTHDDYSITSSAATGRGCVPHEAERLRRGRDGVTVVYLLRSAEYQFCNCGVF